MKINQPTNKTTPTASSNLYNRGITRNYTTTLPHPIAMHSCNIMPRYLFILDAVMTGEFHDETLHIEVETSKKSVLEKDQVDTQPIESSTISIGHNAISIKCEKKNERWKAYSVTIDFPRLLKGHNGWVIQDEDTFLLALSLYLQIMDKLVPDESKGRALPGILPECASYWSRIEFPLQFNDPDKAFFNALYNARHSEVRKPALKVQGQTVTWKGSELTVRCYMKGKQLHEKYKHDISEEDMNVLRVELELKKGKLRQYFNIEEGCRLSTFAFIELYNAFRRGMKGLQGVFHDPNAKLITGTKNAQFIAHLISKRRIAKKVSTADIIDDYLKVTNLKSRQASTLKTDVFKLLNQESERSFLDWFPEKTPLPARNIYPRMKSEDGKVFPVERAIPKDLFINPRIRQAYSEIGSIIFV